MTAVRVGIRWTIGDVRARGFDALRLSIWGAAKLFGPQASYIVCVNNIPLEQARRRTGPMPVEVVWLDTTHQIPAFLRAHLDEQMAEGVGWKLVPPRVFPDVFEISLDNDCILWKMPTAIREWMTDPHQRRCLMAEDVRPCFGQFAEYCEEQEARNAGIRGLPPGFDFEAALRNILARRQAACPGRLMLASELDEQGLQTAALSLPGQMLAVALDEVTVCSPFYPHRPCLGSCGAHFVGLNTRHIPWDYYDRPADEWMDEFWQRQLPEVCERVGITIPEPAC